MKADPVRTGFDRFPSSLAQRMVPWRRWSQRVACQHGGKRAMAAYYRYLLAYHAGFGRKLGRIDWSRVDRVVFVCMGNICRSPYAEAMASAGGARAVSAGLVAHTGVPAHPDAIRNAERRGVDLRLHTAKRIDDLSINESDLLIGMEPPQAWKLQRSAGVGESAPQVTLLGLWIDPAVPYIADPFGCEDDYFQTCYSRIDAGVSAILALIER